MRLRALVVAAVLAWSASPAAAQAPKLGVATQVEFTNTTPGDFIGWRMLEFIYPIEQGDVLRIQVEPVKGAAMNLKWGVHKDNGKDWAFHEGNPAPLRKIDVTLKEGLPGKRVKVTILSETVGKVNVLISKVGDEPEDTAELKKLKDENAALKKELAEMKAQLADIKRLLEKKK